ncbi:MAG: hypothetical protein ACLRL6_12505 [Clostridium sp.]
MVGVNQKGTFLVSQAVTRVFMEKGGVIINPSSCAGLMGSEDIAAILPQRLRFMLYNFWARAGTV